MTSPQLTSYLVVKTKIRNKTKMHTSVTFIKHGTRTPRQEKKNKRCPNWTEVKLSLFANDMVSYIENHKDSAKTSVRTSKFNEVARYKSTYKNQLFSVQ